MIKAPSVCFYDKIQSEVYYNICNKHKKQTTFSAENKIGRIRVGFAAFLTSKKILV